MIRVTHLVFAEAEVGNKKFEEDFHFIMTRIHSSQMYCSSQSDLSLDDLYWLPPSPAADEEV